MIWAVAFERSLFQCLADGFKPQRATETAVDYANEAVKAYGKAIMAGLPVRR